eukprot:TRINITY_DN36144_c0_g1_i2.p1 TRINITY_DN36144_c0_g1~~TRINITY_DN36144_c0_g1_i2.p1  ORF type:complete len:508 (-),score=91.57 TRINITY_DN36144_c0_g1_i2:6-1493(-)
MASATEARLLTASELSLSEGTTAFMFVSTGLVQLMTPGLALFYGGLVGNTSVISVMSQVFMALGVVFLLWTIVAFSLSFGEPILTVGGYHFMGSPATYFMLENVAIYEPLQRSGSVVAAGFPGILFMAYQALIAGSFIDRLRFGPYLIFIAGWILLVYCPLAFWNWGGGWMFQIGAWDFAGGMVVHESSGFSALAAVLLLGRRQFNEEEGGSELYTKPHNIPVVLLGTALLWFGWFGFNGGSALASGGLAGLAMVNSQIAASAGMLSWVAVEWALEGKPKLVGACTGAVCGLVVITPGAGFMQPGKALLAGLLGPPVSIFAVKAVQSSGLDDAIDGVGTHGVGGLLGTILVGIFADPAECGDAASAPSWCVNSGTVVRSPRQVAIQALCGVTTCTYAFAVTYALIWSMARAGIAPALRSWKEQESARDVLQHGEIAYITPVLEPALLKPSYNPNALVSKIFVDDDDIDSGASDSDSQSAASSTRGHYKNFEMRRY